MKPFYGIFLCLLLKAISVRSITGGTAAYSGQLPALVYLIFEHNDIENYCGGSLIDLLHVLTSADCVAQVPPWNIGICGDEVNWEAESLTRQDRRAILNVVHPHYEASLNQHNIAVLRMDRPFIASKTFYPLRPALKTPYDANSCITGGWGANSGELNGANVLQVAKITVITDCQQKFGWQLADASYCGVGVSGENLCADDSGGGLFCDGFLVGIITNTSMGKICEDVVPIPGVYTDISQYSDFIRSAINYQGKQAEIAGPGNGGSTIVPLMIMMVHCYFIGVFFSMYFL